MGGEKKKKRRSTVLLLRRFCLRCSSATRATASSQPHHRASASACHRCSLLHPRRRDASSPDADLKLRQAATRSLAPPQQICPEMPRRCYRP
ncbi:hypothetical protein EUGRSUZ_B02083 [Eucalyptus grandis]|uniref:Uncharacterized protein n=2 Tax=Eucalyptus grandis TaxID=71139 RepID=A0ACC3LRM9_EUCGR|nr:hypothetical protein EUGRSUZ_B02083 [Eucalyptus grandis]